VPGKPHATEGGTPVRSRLRTAVRRRSWEIHGRLSFGACFNNLQLSAQQASEGRQRIGAMSGRESSLPALPRRILRLTAVLYRTGLTRSTLRRLLDRGEFPQPKRLGLRALGWLEADIERWIANR
jgi:prophage regulatory protein